MQLMDSDSNSVKLSAKITAGRGRGRERKRQAPRVSWSTEEDAAPGETMPHQGGAALGSTGRDRPTASCPGTATVGACRGQGRRTAAPAQHPRRAVVAPPMRCEEEGAWRRMRVAAVPCALT